MSKPILIGDFEVSKSIAGLPHWNIKYRGVTVETTDTKREAVARIDELKLLVE